MVFTMCEHDSSALSMPAATCELLRCGTVALDVMHGIIDLDIEMSL